jgi:hypothetical protein
VQRLAVIDERNADLFFDGIEAALVRVVGVKGHDEDRGDAFPVGEPLAPFVKGLLFVGLELDPVVEPVLCDDIVDVLVVPGGAFAADGLAVVGEGDADGPLGEGPAVLIRVEGGGWISRSLHSSEAWEQSMVQRSTASSSLGNNPSGMEYIKDSTSSIDKIVLINFIPSQG